MHIIVLGSGIIGVTTAYYLARDGHQVSVIDRQPEAAMETSQANAGQISPGYSAPWAAPGIPLKALKWMLSKHSPLVVRPKLDPYMWRWMGQMLSNCTQHRYDLNKGRMLRLAEYSRQSFQSLRQETGIEYDQRSLGTLQLFRSQKQLDAAINDMAVLDRLEVPYELLDRAGCIAAEPALAKVSDKILGGLRLPLDETGDCFKFTQELATRCTDLGVKFHYGAAIHSVSHSAGRVTGIATDQGTFSGDAYVSALGSYSRPLLKPLGLDLPIYPVKGYSITLPIKDADSAPVSTVMDETYKVAITRLGDRIRVGGTAELTGFDLALRDKRIATLKHVVNDLFPDGGAIQQADPWTGLRPMTPDGAPILGQTAYSNLYLNTGHGTLGWTMSCGSGRLLAEMIAQRDPAISTEGLTLARYGKHQGRNRIAPEPSLSLG